MLSPVRPSAANAPERRKGAQGKLREESLSVSRRMATSVSRRMATSVSRRNPHDDSLWDFSSASPIMLLQAKKISNPKIAFS